MASKRARSGFEWLRVALTELEDASSGLESTRRASGTYRERVRLKSGQLESAIYSFIHGLVLLYIDLLVRRRSNHRVLSS